MAAIKTLTINASVTDDSDNTIATGSCVCIKEIYIKNDHLELGLCVYKSATAHSNGKQPIKVAAIGGNYKPTATDAEIAATAAPTLAANKLKTFLEGIYGAGNVTID